MQQPEYEGLTSNAIWKYENFAFTKNNLWILNSRRLESPGGLNFERDKQW